LAAKKTVYIPDELFTQLEEMQEGREFNVSAAFQAFLSRYAEKTASMKAAIQTSEDSPYWSTVRPSMVRRVAQGASYWTSVDVLEAGGGAPAIRLTLEEMSIKVNLLPYGTTQHIVNVLSGVEATAPYLVIGSSMYADDGNIPLPQNADEIDASQPFRGSLSPDDLRSFVDLPGRTVFALGGDMGDERIAQAFLDAGCAAYVGPQGGPFWYGASFMVNYVFYELTQQRPLAAALERLRAHDTEMAMWRLFQARA